MRFAAALLFALCACSSEPSPNDAGSDAGLGMDAEPDGGVVQVPCKTLTCNGSIEYCKLTPVGPCNIVDAGACPGGEEACVTTGGSGCTEERTPSCEDLGGCTGCACLIATNPCGPGTQSITCRGLGAITLECPYP